MAGVGRREEGPSDGAGEKGSKLANEDSATVVGGVFFRRPVVFPTSRSLP